MFTYEWKCPHPDCKYVVTAYGSSSFEVLKELHLDKHVREAQKLLENFEKNRPEFEKTLTTTKNYDKFELTEFDKGFLKTRGIKVEE
jgi:hypothetical protein